MSDELDIKLGSRDGHAQFRHAFAKLIRAEAFEEAENFLGEQAISIQTEIGDICRNLPLDAVEIIGWDKISTKINRYTGNDLISAIGVDLSSHVENAKNLQGGIEPGLEVNYFSDKYYPFSTASQSDILHATENGGAPWQGNFIDIDNVLEMRGLARLNTALHSRRISPMIPPNPVPPGFADVLIGTGYQLLRFHQSLARDARRYGLPRPMPILAGEHDFNALYIDSVYMVDRITERHDTSHSLPVKDEKADGEQKKEWSKRFYAERTEKLIDEITQYREQARNPLTHPKRIAIAKKAITSFFKDEAFPISRPIWEMDDADFAILVHRIRYIRDPEGTPPPPLHASRPGVLRRLNPLGFGRKRP